jgi:hypothetical protein
VKTSLILGILFIPAITFAAADECKIVEFSDHFEVVCEGDGTKVPVPPGTVFQQPVPAPAQATDSGETSARPVETALPVRKVPGSPEVSVAGAPIQTPASATTQRNMQRRPNSADLNAAIEARRKLILEQRPKE